jgi:O-methyltransferase
MKINLSYLMWKTSPWLATKRYYLDNNRVLDNAEFMAAYLELISESRILLGLRDMHNLYHHVVRCKSLEGEMAEVGVFRGGSAKLISMFKGNAKLHLFDTFAGMPATDKTIDHHNAGDFDTTTLEDVQAYLAGYSQIEYHKGYFPDTANSAITSRSFSFVHLDVDIYQSTLDGLNFSTRD